jgi:hypothetical protein
MHILAVIFPNREDLAYKSGKGSQKVAVRGQTLLQLVSFKELTDTPSAPQLHRDNSPG